jgi:hypothetical protein
MLIGFTYKRIENTMPTVCLFFDKKQVVMLEDLLAAMVLCKSYEWQNLVTHIPFNVEVK